MKTFSTRELKVVKKLKQLPPYSTLYLEQSCPNHSSCTPLPLFRVYRLNEETFKAEWNGHHQVGPRQVFQFSALDRTEGKV